MEGPHVYVMDGDIKKAYDYVSHSAFAVAARQRGMHEVLIHAWLREWRRTTSIFRLDSETTSGGVMRTRSLPQGDPSAPMIFNAILDTLAKEFLAMATARCWGLRLCDNSWVNLILFADNYWFVATSPQMLCAMTSEWLRLLGEVGWETPTEELTWCTTEQDSVKMDIKINEETTRRTEYYGHL